MTRKELIVVIAVTMLLIVPLYGLTATYDAQQINDTASAAQAGWMFATTGDLAFDEEWPEDQVAQGAEGRDGRLYSNRFPGILGTSAIAYSIAIGLGITPDDPVDHPHDVPFGPAGAAAVLIAALAAALTYLLFRELPISRRLAIVAGVFIATGTPLWSVSANALWTHGPTHVLLVGVLLALLRDRTLLAATLAAMAVTFRPHLALALLVLAFAAPRCSARAATVVGAVAGLGLVAAYSMWIFGQPLPAADHAEILMQWQIPLLDPAFMAVNLVGWLTASNSGILLYVPILVLAAPRLARGWRDSPDWVHVAVLGGVAYAMVQLSLARASGGHDFFGHRTTIESLVLAAPLLLMTLRRVVRDEGSPARHLVAVVLLGSVALHGYGAYTGLALFEVPKTPVETQDEFSDSALERELRGISGRSSSLAQGHSPQPRIEIYKRCQALIATSVGSSGEGRSWSSGACGYLERDASGSR